MLGAVIGIQEGDQRLVSEDLFLGGDLAALSLYIVAGQARQGKTVSAEI